MCSEGTDWKEVFEYEDGFLVTKEGMKYRKGGEMIGCLNGNGYLHFSFRGKHYTVHRVVYEMHYGKIPEGMQIDHVNGLRTDNRIENLRLVTNQENCFNNTKAKGYYFDKSRGKYLAQIRLDGKTKSIGRFDTEEEARKAYLSAKNKTHVIECRQVCSDSLCSHGCRDTIHKKTFYKDYPRSWL